MNRPQIDNAPGLAWTPIKEGWLARWRARHDLIARGYEPKSVRLWSSTAERPEPSALAITYIQDHCNRLQSQMLVWGRGGIPQLGSYDGTLRALVHSYQTDADSTYRKARYRTRVYYDCLCRRIIAEHGDDRIEDIRTRHVLRWHEEWAEQGKHIPRAHALVTMLRTLINFGASILEDDGCERLSILLHKQKFEQAKPRTERLTADQAIAIRAEAHKRGLPSIALAQAIQFELMLRQKDCLGEWVPLSEAPLSTVTHGNMKWLRGITWAEIDQHWVLRHITSKRQKEIERNLMLAPMVREELGPDRSKHPTSGPVIVCETTGKPWNADQFRTHWRSIATALGIPKTVRNMDSRAGAITEATEAGADLEAIKHAATHSDISMTQRYARGSTEKAADVMEKRVAFRNKSGTK